MKYAIITDIHGYYDKLQVALEKAYNMHPDKIIFLGDYFDRAPAILEYKMMKWLIEHIDDKDKIFILGNHDQWFISELMGKMEDRDFYNWCRPNNGGMMTSIALSDAERNGDKDIRDGLIYAYDKMRRLYIDGNNIFSHAGVEFEDDLITVYDVTMWNLNHENSAYYNYPYTFHIGHVYNWLTVSDILKIKLPRNWSKLRNEDLNWDLMPGNYHNFRLYDSGACINALIDLYVGYIKT